MKRKSDTLLYIINHLFLPARLPESDDHAIENDLAVCDLAIGSAQRFEKDISSSLGPNFAVGAIAGVIVKMLTKLRTLQFTNSLVEQELRNMLAKAKSGDNLIIPIRAQNACVILRRLKGRTVYESFEVDPPNAEVMATEGRLVRSFPGPAFEITDTEATDSFECEFASYLAKMDVSEVDSAPVSVKAGSKVMEVRDTTDPHYITHLLTAIIHGLPNSKPADVERVEKRVRNEIMWNKAYKPWRRSPLWLIIRVALQTTLRQTGGSQGHTYYKVFMISLFADVLLFEDCSELPSDLLVSLRDKVSRRLGKLSEAASESLISKATSAIEKTNDILRERWARIQSERAHAQLSPPWAPDTLSPSTDTHISLLSSKNYLAQRLQQSKIPLDKPTFQPSEFPRITDDIYHSPNTDILSAALARDPYVALADIEQFAQNRLDAWVNRFRSNITACITIGNCITLYAETAKAKYAGNPEDQSLMLLTIFLLWSALDELAIAQHPMLKEYSPEIPQSLLEPLLLRKALPIQRLVAVQAYLSRRHERAFRGSAFTDALTPSSFVIRHFDASEELALLKLNIEQIAQAERDAKLKELNDATSRYKSLKQQAGSMEHTYTQDGRHRLKKCQKCVLSRKADAMDISVHEWPLPSKELPAKAAVFELRCPAAFHTWRTTTYAILFDVCRPGLPVPKTTPKVETKLSAFAGLRNFHGTLPRITYASPTKSFMKSHYSTVKVADARADTIAVNNALNFRLFDESLERWVAGSFSDCASEALCTFKLPQGSPYFALQYAVDGTAHSANQPIAEQADVPPGLDLHQHVAFGTLRSGPKLQWLNILRELRTRTLSFDRHEVQLLFMQAALQIGPISGNEPEWHYILKDPTFGKALLSEIDDLVSNVEGNWHHIITVQTLIILMGRLLAATVEKTVVDFACYLLWRVRNITFKWMLCLLDDLQDTGDESASQLIQQRICAAAATCRAAYDHVDSDFFERFLAEDGDIDVLIQCSIRLLDGTPSGDLPDDLKYLLARDRRSSRSLAPILSGKLNTSGTAINNSIHALWSTFSPGSPWRQLAEPNDRWIMCTTSTTLASISSMVHLNLFDGTLLINGKPLARLPSSIVDHPTYVRLLGQRTFDVIPSGLVNMDFATRSLVFGHLHLHFKLSEPDRVLIIQAECGSCSELYELIPHTIFNDTHSGPDFPSAFLEDYAHWLRLGSTSGEFESGHTMEFHPLKSVWKPSHDNWNLHFTANGATMQQGPFLSMVDIRSQTCDMVSTCLQPLEARDCVHIRFDTNSSRVLVDLPRYNLSFFLNDTLELESNTIRGMVVDSNQSAGAMFGLASQLVLKAVDSRITELNLPGSRSVIIPFGDPAFETSKFHTGVHIQLESHVRSVKYFKYDIDNVLGRLVGTTLLSDLYKIYLHACTSFPFPDPLTNRTGTEEALNELRSARCLSFQALGTDEIAVLHKIADLSPVLEWYPKHLRSMQTIHWHRIRPLGQHWALNIQVQAILQFQRELSSLGMEDTQQESRSPGKDHLLTRFISRNFSLYASMDIPPPSQSDARYPLSDHLNDPQSRRSDEHNVKFAADVSALVQSMPSRLHTVPNLWTRLEALDSLQSDENAQFSLSFQSDFLRPSLSQLFLPFYNRCRKSQSLDARTKLTFTLTAMAYASPRHADLLPTLLAFATLPLFRTIDPPQWGSYNLKSGVIPDKEMLRSVIEKYPLPADMRDRHIGESHEQFLARRKASLRAQIDGLADLLVKQGSCIQPRIPQGLQFSLIELGADGLKTEVSGLFRDWFKNMQFQEYVNRVQLVLDDARLLSSPPIPSTTTPYRVLRPPSPQCTRDKQHLPTTLRAILARRDPPAQPTPVQNITSQDSTLSKLEFLVEEFKSNPRALHRQYGIALENSRDSHVQNQVTISHKMPISLEQLQHHYESRRSDAYKILEAIEKQITPETTSEKVEYLAGKWPRATARSVLALLAENATSRLYKPAWRNTFVLFAQSLVKVQRAQRLLRFKLSESVENLSKELENDQFEKDPSFHHPEWLLIQIDGNFTVRPIQSRMAQEMISPSSERNTLSQLNMGEGKSSVIVPLISATLADGDKLVRVVVLKPLVNQMFQLLVRRLSGLANRRIFYLPFSRDFKPTLSRLALLRSLYKACMKEQGVLLVQPEHILSFKLMGVDLAGGAHGREVTDTLLATQRWLTSVSRDILDESDEILSVTYQLVYTSGLQEPLENHPDRWTTVQEVLGYAKKHARRLHATYPFGLEIKAALTSEFPVIRILEADAGESLIKSIAEEVASSERLRLLPQDMRQAALDFVTGRGGGSVGVNELGTRLKGTSEWKYLLLCRGFLGHGLMRFVLQEKRWRVDYGLDPTRTLLAVPYRAKDVPSLRADFGHPDVAVALTCLSYYYGGLTEEQLDTAFQLLFKLDNPALEYKSWVSGRGKDDELPDSLREIIGVNLEDQNQRKYMLIPLFRRNQAAIDFYLSNVVFPKDAKQFPEKLAASSWDLAEIKGHVITGFSGTNDNRYLLPTSIEQADPLNQLSTNAKVLSYLLQPENDSYLCLHRDGQPLSSNDFLELLVNETPPLRVLLDVGAQMLDMQNTELVSTWLSLAPDIQAIVFFDDTDELVVMSQDKTIERLISSQFNDKLDLCAVYLDDAHTRGTDLKLPGHFRAAVTLGPKLVKDRLVQGCMRMRLLGRGQSVMFFAPPEVDKSIRELAPSESREVKSMDILRWVMHETCVYMQRHLSHWAQQGVEYKRREAAWLLHESQPSTSLALERLRSSWEEPDARSLEEMYAPQSCDHGLVLHSAFEIPDLKERLDHLGVLSLENPGMDEEHEREVSHEAERERQLERPEKAQFASSRVHNELRKLVVDGTFAPRHSSVFVPLFSPLEFLGKHQWPAALFSTLDFATTIRNGKSAGYYLRPVNWIISLTRDGILVVLSPYEVNELLPEIHKSKHVHLHMYSPRVNQARKSFEDLKFFSIPPRTWSPPSQIQISQINLWAGQLYLKDYDTYRMLCKSLGVVGDETTGESGQWESDGFIKPENRKGVMAEQCELTTNPLLFLKELISSRRKGMNYSSTHMGKILNARLLTQEDFE